MPIKITLSYYFSPSSWQKSKSLTTVGKAARKQALLNIACGNTKWYNPHGRKFGNI